MSGAAPPVNQSPVSAVKGRFTLGKWATLGIVAAIALVALFLVVFPDNFISWFTGSEGPRVRNSSPNPQELNTEAFQRDDKKPEEKHEASASRPAPHRHRSYASNVSAFDASAIDQTSNRSAQSAPGQPTAGNGTTYGQDAMGQQLAGLTDLPTQKGHIQKHPDFVLSAGGHIPCDNVEAINTSGGAIWVTCHVGEWIQGDTLRRNLLPPGTKIVGQIRNGMQAGQRRLAVVYTGIHAGNMKMPMSALASDPLGRAGLDIDINTFFLETLEAVAAYALIDLAQSAVQGGIQAMLQNATKGTGTYLNFNTNSGGQNLAQMMLQSRLNRPPEGTRDQALPLNVTIGQDLDFFDMCVQRMKYDTMACPVR